MFSRLLALFIFIPLLELYFFITVGRMITFPVTLLIIVVTAIIGASLTKREGLSVIGRMQSASRQGKIPHEEVTEGVLILIAGALLLTPGFLTDIFGFSLLFPPSRAVYRKKLADYFKGKIKIVPGPAGFSSQAPPKNVNTAKESTKQSKDGDVIDVEVL